MIQKELEEVILNFITEDKNLTTDATHHLDTTEVEMILTTGPRVFTEVARNMNKDIDELSFINKNKSSLLKNSIN